MIYGIIVVFYENKYQSAIREFENLIQSIGKEYEILVVSNNPKIVLNNSGFIHGDDLTSEFSGWQKGLDFLNEKNINNSDSLFILANDTFCHHRTWGSYEKNVFSNSFRKNINKKNKFILGEVDSFRKTFNILSYKSNSWVSTYLFAISFKTLNEIKFNICINEADFKKIYLSVLNNNVKWSPNSDLYLSKKISHWLSPSNPNGWYRKNNDDHILEIKLKAILSEIYLSSKIKNSGGDILNVYSDIPIHQKLIRKINISRRMEIIRNLLFSKIKI